MHRHVLVGVIIGLSIVALAPVLNNMLWWILFRVIDAIVNMWAQITHRLRAWHDP